MGTRPEGKISPESKTTVGVALTVVAAAVMIVVWCYNTFATASDLDKQEKRQFEENVRQDRQTAEMREDMREVRRMVTDIWVGKKR